MEGVADELAALLRQHGASDDEIAELAEPGATLPIGELLIRSERPTLNLTAAAQHAGLGEADALRIWGALGFPRPAPDSPLLGEQELETSLRLLGVAWQLFGPDDTLQLARVLGSAINRIADAVVSTFHVRLGGPALASDPTRFALAQATVAATTMLDSLGDAVELLLRRHVLALMRPFLVSDTGADHDSVDLAAGFVDLAGFTKLAQSLSLGELSRLLGRFENLAQDVITGHGGRLVKTIGDEVMFVAQEPTTACLIGSEILAGLEARDLPPARGGIDYGEVLTRGGDYFGSVVNVASRLVSLAEPGSILVSDRARAAAERSQDASQLSFTPSEARQVRGVAEPIGVSALVLPA